MCNSKKQELTPEREIILRIFENSNKPLKAADIAEMLGKSRNNSNAERQLIFHLEKDGYLKKVAYGKYVATNRAKEEKQMFKIGETVELTNLSEAQEKLWGLKNGQKVVIISAPDEYNDYRIAINGEEKLSKPKFLKKIEEAPNTCKFCEGKPIEWKVGDIVRVRGDLNGGVIRQNIPKPRDGKIERGCAGNCSKTV